MRLELLIRRVRSITRDFSNSIFREQDIIDFINEGIDRFKQLIPELESLEYLVAKNETPSLIPSQYISLLAIYSSSRCFTQDERHYQASTLMNEFEIKLEDLRNKIENGEITIIDPETGEVIENDYDIDYVSLYPYWTNKKPRDEGVL